MDERAAFVVLEGVDGAGKTTLAKALARRCGFLYTKEPYNPTLRAVLKRSHEELSRAASVKSLAELYLVLADRALHLAEVVVPALLRGESVVCDRFYPSTFAYQAHLGGVEFEWVMDLHERLFNAFEKPPWPDLIVVLEASPDVLLKRLASKPDPSGFDRASPEILQKLAEGYRRFSELSKVPVVYLDAAMEKGALLAELTEVLGRFLGRDSCG